MPHPATWRVSKTCEMSLDKPRIMAIINVTPDSFYDGGVHFDLTSAVDAAHRFVQEGADILDIGGESTRPGASSVSEAEQIARIQPVIQAIRAHLDTPISIDTTRAHVARAALDAGADAVNDVSAGLDDPAMLPLIAERGAGVVLMHRLTTPDRDSYSDQYDRNPDYADVVQQVRQFLESRIAAALDARIRPECIVVDPGLGFGKSVEQNLELIRRTSELASLGRPVLSGLSRKSFIGRVAHGDSQASDRLPATLAASVGHLLSGASIFRVHDVASHVSALSLAWAIRGGVDVLAVRDARA